MLLWTVKIFLMTGRDFITNGRHFHNDRSRFPWWFQVENFGKIQERKGSISSSKFYGQLWDNVVTCLCPIHLLNSILLVRCWWYVCHEDRCFGFSGFGSKWVHSQGESRYSMVGRYSKVEYGLFRHFCGGLLYRKLTEWMTRPKVIYVLFGWFTGCVRFSWDFRKMWTWNLWRNVLKCVMVSKKLNL